MNTTSLSEISIPDKVEYIGSKCFSYSGIKNVKLPKNDFFTVIYDKTFFECANLEKVILPNSIYKICSYAFANCKSLQRINLDNIKLLYDKAFAGTALEKISCPQYANALSLTAITVDGRTSFLITVSLKADSPMIVIPSLIVTFLSLLHSANNPEGMIPLPLIVTDSSLSHPRYAHLSTFEIFSISRFLTAVPSNAYLSISADRFPASRLLHPEKAHIPMNCT